MMSLRAALLCPDSSCPLARPSPRPLRLAVARAVIESVSPDGASLTVRTRASDQETVHLGDKTAVTLVLPAALADVKPGAFIGVAALPGDGRPAEGDGGACLSRGDARDGRGPSAVRPRPGQHHDQRRGLRAGRRRRRRQA